MQLASHVRVGYYHGGGVGYVCTTQAGLGYVSITRPPIRVVTDRIIFADRQTLYVMLNLIFCTGTCIIDTNSQ